MNETGLSLTPGICILFLMTSVITLDAVFTRFYFFVNFASWFVSIDLHISSQSSSSFLMRLVEIMRAPILFFIMLHIYGAETESYFMPLSQ